MAMRKATIKVMLIALLLSSVFKAYAQETGRTLIPRTIGSIELGEYVTERMIKESFALEVPYQITKLHEVSIYSVKTKITYFNVPWNEIVIDKSNDDYSAIAISFIANSESVEALFSRYNQLRGDLCGLWGDGKVTSYGMSEITSIWEDAETVVRLCVIDRDASVRLMLSFIDKTPVDSF